MMSGVLRTVKYVVMIFTGFLILMSPTYPYLLLPSLRDLITHIVAYLVGLAEAIGLFILMVIGLFLLGYGTACLAFGCEEKQ